MNRIDQLTDNVTALLDKREAEQRFTELWQSIAIMRDLCDCMVKGEGWDLLDRAQVRLEKQALRIGIDAGLL
jgi:hypothetical protein